MRYAQLLGQSARISNEALQVLRWIALLHDLGKIRIPGELLRSSAILTQGQMDLVREHARYGEAILGRFRSPRLRGIAYAVGSHHERYDGSGYPRGLSGDAIPLLARIVTVCDAFDTMISGRPYASPKSPARALEELVALSGTQFDPRLVDLFVRDVAPIAITPQRHAAVA